MFLSPSDAAPVTALIVMAGLFQVMKSLGLGEELRARRKIQELELDLKVRQQEHAEKLAKHQEELMLTTMKAQVEPIPPDLAEAIKSESSKWFREELEQRVRQLFAQHGNWDKVRSEIYAELS